MRAHSTARNARRRATPRSGWIDGDLVPAASVGLTRVFGERAQTPNRRCVSPLRIAASYRIRRTGRLRLAGDETHFACDVRPGPGDSVSAVRGRARGHDRGHDGPVR